ncbi:AAA-domain-containing protein [Setomelanomma holmii]|uniref:AAA-domain-containing protein n=1 Tax=Setomelanomma holmii TaxID=210430 RepID=A0A9P4HJ61_9PLEO|nr:AAA-domain-containing protein [Setomelanomma holmii]
MYVIRPALRASTGRPPARFIRGRRYPSPPRLRSFHTTRTLAQAANPPPAPDSTPVGDNDARETSRDKAAAEEHVEGSVATEDPELLAQKLQRSRETSRRYSAALRRQQRSKKAQGLPPVHIPDWFLKQRVIRREDRTEHTTKLPGLAALSVSVSHAETGEQATCSIPASRDLDAAQVLSRLVRGLWGRRLDDHEKRKVEKYLDERIALVEKGELADSAETAKDVNTSIATEVSADLDEQATTATYPQAFAALERSFQATLAESNTFEDKASHHERFTREMVELHKLASKLDELRADPNLSPEQRLEAARKQEAKIERWIKRRVAGKTRRASPSRRISPLILAEIQATIIASLHALGTSVGDSFPSAKTNLILHSPAAEHEKLVDACLQRIANDQGSDLITLKAQDLAQLAGDYLGEGPEPTPRSVRSLGYETYRMSSELQSVADDLAEAAEGEAEFNQASPMDQPDPMRVRAFHLPMIAVAPALRALSQSFKGLQLPGGVGVAQFDQTANDLGEDSGHAQSANEIQLEDLKIAALLDALVDANEAKKTRGLVGIEGALPGQASGPSVTPIKAPAFFDYSVGSDGTILELNSALPANADAGISMAVSIGNSFGSGNGATRAKIVYVKDFKELNATHYGGRIIQKLEELVRKRRASGERIMIVGSTCSRELTPELSARTIVIEAESGPSPSGLDEAFAASRADTSSSDLSPAEKSKFRSVNLSHIRQMLKSLDFTSTTKIADMEQSTHLFRMWASIFPDSYLRRVLTYDEVHRIALTALGLHVTTNRAQTVVSQETKDQLSWAHVALAMGLIKASDTSKYASFDKAAALPKKPRSLLGGEAEAKLNAKQRQDEKSLRRQRELHQIASSATKHEKRLMPGIADPDQIKTTFEQVHVPQETIDSIRTITSLSLLRPDAFNYGILATEKISGALLYGPPGTGKTLLAKAVAKESGSTVLEVSGSQIMDKYVGEGEKNVAAIFSLARKLSPCIVFLDEADAVFASRDAMRERTSHRDILNQFLKEWDGLNDLSVFVMVATNRPFDLDDAVIRRLPRRLLVDLPTHADRKEILRIHLKGEQLDDSVDLEDLAKRTPFYSGSDLKNIAVSAALACVKEENEQAALAAAKATLETHPASTESKDESASAASDATSTESASSSPATAAPEVLHLVRGQTYNFPEKRVLHARHFDKAIQEISASISEDMSSLNAIKKFDEQYGDRKGNKRRKDFGFGVLTERNESAARVRV